MVIALVEDILFVCPMGNIYYIVDDIYNFIKKRRLMEMLNFIFGMFIGSLIGVAIMCFCAVSGEWSRDEEMRLEEMNKDDTFR